MTFALEKLQILWRGFLVLSSGLSKGLKGVHAAKRATVTHCVRRGQAEKILEWMTFETFLIVGHEIQQVRQQGEGTWVLDV